MNAPLRLVIAEDYPPDVDLLLAELRRAGYDPKATVVDSRDAFIAALDSDPQVVLCDYTLPSMTAPDALQILGLRSPDLPLIVVSGTMDEAVCVTSLRLGAADYLLKDRLGRWPGDRARAAQARTRPGRPRGRTRAAGDAAAAAGPGHRAGAGQRRAAGAGPAEGRLRRDSVSHELRTPLTTIRGYAELLLDGDAGPRRDLQPGCSA